MQEIWKDIKEWPYYQISNLGRVKSLARYSNVCGGGKRLVKERILKLNTKGLPTHRYYVLSINNKIIRIHRLVAEYFVPNPHPRKFKYVNHKNGIKLDNNAENLEWTTKSYDLKHAYDNGLRSSTRKVICIETGKIFPTIQNAIENLGIKMKRATIRRQLNYGKKITTTLRYVK